MNAWVWIVLLLVVIAALAALWYVTQGYRAAHALSLANDHGKASTEDLRPGMIHYRSLFGNLLAPEAGSRKAP